MYARAVATSPFDTANIAAIGLTGLTAPGIRFIYPIIDAAAFSRSPFPGISALPSCIGTVFVPLHLLLPERWKHRPALRSIEEVASRVAIVSRVIEASVPVRVLHAVRPVTFSKAEEREREQGSTTVADGVVTLRGKLARASTRNAAKAAVESVRGVRRVVNNISTAYHLGGRPQGEIDADHHKHFPVRRAVSNARGR